MNKKLFKTVATLATASLVMLSTATCFAADPITTTTTSTFDFSTGNVTVTTTANGVGSGKMITYLLSDNETVSSGSNILFIDQKTTKDEDVTFTCTVDIEKLETAAAVLKMGSNAGYTFTKEGVEDLAAVVLQEVAEDSDVKLVNAFTNNEGMTVIAKVVSPTANTKYGAIFTKDGKEYRIYALGSSLENSDEDGNAVGTGDLSNGKYYAITVTGLNDYKGCTLVPFAE